MLRPDILVRDADAALYSAKAFGRDQVYVFRERSATTGRSRRAPIAVRGASARALDVGREVDDRGLRRALLRLRWSGRPSWAGKPSTMIAEASVAGGPRDLTCRRGELERIRTASLLHDLGKLATPNETPRQARVYLAASEWRVVAEHPKIGQVVLEQAGALRDAATIVLHHHEWYDGLRLSARPRRPPRSRLGRGSWSIVDAYEAMICGPAVSCARDLP